MKPSDYDDKDLVIIATLILGIISMIALPDVGSKEIIISIISGLFGIAVGRKDS